MALAYLCYCPLGEVCGKKHRMLKKKWSEEDARWAVQHHLMTSPAHMMTRQEAEGFAMDAEIPTWEEEQEEADVEDTSEKGKGKKGGQKRDHVTMKGSVMAEVVARTVVRQLQEQQESGAVSRHAARRRHA